MLVIHTILYLSVILSFGGKSRGILITLTLTLRCPQMCYVKQASTGCT